MRNGNDRNGAVNRKEITISEPKITEPHCKQNTRYGMRQESDRIERAAKAYLSSDNNPRHKHAQEHGRCWHRDHENRRIDERQGVDEFKNAFIIAERHLRERLDRWKLQMRQQRRPDENRSEENTSE